MSASISQIQYQTPLAWCLLTLFFVSCSPSTSQKAQLTLKNYLSYAEKKNPAAIYEQLSLKQKENLTLEAFLQQWKSHQFELKEQRKRLQSQLQKPLKLKATIRVGGQNSLVLVLDGDRWKIDKCNLFSFDGSSIRTVLKSLIQAIEHRNFKQVMNLLANSTRDSIDREIQDRLERLKDSANHKIELSGNKAILRYGPEYKIEFVKEKDVWRILDFN